jgi:hypothetical protein
MEDETCSREDCTQKVWGKISLEGGKQECFEHYLETLLIVEIVRRFTGTPAITIPEVEIHD